MRLGNLLPANKIVACTLEGFIASKVTYDVCVAKLAVATIICPISVMVAHPPARGTSSAKL